MTRACPQPAGSRSRNPSHLQDIARLGVARRGAAVLAGGDAGEGDELAPPERRARGGEFLAARAVVLLGVEGAVLAGGVAEHQVQHAAGVVAELAVLVDDRAGAGLEIAANRLV